MRIQFTLVFILAACSPEPASVPTPTWSGEIVAIYGDDAVGRLCVGSLPHLDRYVERIFEALEDSRPAESLQIQIQVDEETPCLPGSDACYDPEDKRIYMYPFEHYADAFAPSLRHEITHAVVHHIWGRGIPFFDEGLAEAFSRSDEPSGASGPLVPVGDLLDAKALELDYHAAARFTRFLIDTYGAPRFKRLYQEAQERSQEAIRAKVLEVYGRTFEALEAEFLSGPRCLYQFDTCDPEAAMIVFDAWSTSLVLSCEDPSFIGFVGTMPEGSAYPMTTSLTLAVQSPGRYILSSDTWLSFVRCGTCAEQSAQMLWGDQFELDLDAGLYSVEFNLGAQSAGVAALELVATD